MNNLFSRLGLARPSFWQGFGSLFDFAGTQASSLQDFRDNYPSDADALKGDWEAIWQDLHTVLPDSPMEEH